MLAAPDSSISQGGLVPAGVHWLLFKAATGAHSTVEASLGGEKLSLQALGTEANYTVYGANISAFSGQTTTLTFTSSGYLSEIDDIEFVVPEPGAAPLLLIGLGLLRYVRRRRLSAGDQRSVGRDDGDFKSSPLAGLI